MRRMKQVIPALVVLLLLAGEAPACPNCKEAVAAQDAIATVEGKPTTFMKNGYNYSVLFMMVMPFALLGTGALMVARAVKRGALPEF